MVTVRRLRPEEWRVLRALRLRALADAPDAFGSTLAAEEADDDERWQRRADPPGGVVMVAVRRGDPVGLAFGARAPIEGEVAGLFGMWVDPAVRGRGVGAKLVAAVVDWARAAGYDSIGLGVTTTNRSAIVLYERMGFTDTGEHHPLRDGTDLEIQVMRRRID